MSTRAEQLEQQVARERHELTQRLHRIQDKLEDATNPKVIYRDHPSPMLVAAFCGGMLLGALTAPQPQPHVRDSFARLRGAGGGRERAQQPGAWRQVRNAVVGMVVARLSEVAVQQATQLLGGGRHRRTRRA